MTLRAASAALLATLVLAAPASAAYPGTNGLIAFTSTRDTGYGDLYAMAPDGSGAKRLTTTGLSDHAAWSPNGRRIAFASGRDGDWDVYVMNVDGTGATNLTDNSTEDDMDPTWSPDGSRLAFVSYRDGNSEIYTMDADGSNQANRTNNASYDEAPAWSPDGSKIAFLTGRGGGEAEIYTIDPDGSNVTNLTNDRSVAEYDPDWSPDGAQIAFSTFRDGNTEIYKMNANGTARTRLTNNAIDIDDDPAWSPDGTKIAFFSYRFPDDQGIFVMNADGSGLTRISPGSTYDTAPDWQPVRLATPASASSLNVSLAPAFKQCGTLGNPATGGHAPPQAVGSCSPVPVSDVARLGAQSTGTASFTVAPADVSIAATLSDVQTVAGGDYAPNPSGPDLSLDGRLRITDARNGDSGGDLATTFDLDFPSPMECIGTGNPVTGSACSVNTSANAVVPGFVVGGRTTILQAFRVRILDAGADGSVGNADDRLLATQGVFVP